MTTSEERTCPCGGTEFEAGFIDDTHIGTVRWFEGGMLPGPLGSGRQMGRKRRAVEALRCTRCSRLELYAVQVL